VITCSRCGKDNQDLYKFCLSCGAKLQAGVAPAPKPALVPEMYPATPPPVTVGAPIGAVKPAGPPLDESFDSMGTDVPMSTPQPDFATTSPMKGLGVTPPPVVVAPAISAPVAPAPVAPAPVAPMSVAPSPRLSAPSSTSSVPSVQIGIGSVPMQVPTRQSPQSVALASSPPPPSSWQQPSAAPATMAPPVHSPHVSPFSPPPTETVACPKCGKLVASAFAFCGGCGHRMKAAPGAVAEPALPRAEAVAP
jgi:hypothetical protein